MKKLAFILPFFVLLLIVSCKKPIETIKGYSQITLETHSDWTTHYFTQGLFIQHPPDFPYVLSADYPKYAVVDTTGGSSREVFRSDFMCIGQMQPDCQEYGTVVPFGRAYFDDALRNTEFVDASGKVIGVAFVDTNCYNNNSCVYLCWDKEGTNLEIESVGRFYPKDEAELDYWLEIFKTIR